MKLMEKIWEAAKSDKRKIVLPEGNEERTITAAQRINELGLAHPILIGNKEEIIVDISIVILIILFVIVGVKSIFF